MQEIIDKFQPLYHARSELERSIFSKGIPVLTALKIAGSRLDIAFSSQSEEDFRKAQRDLARAKQYYEFYEVDDKIAEGINLLCDMRTDLHRDHPHHYLLQD